MQLSWYSTTVHLFQDFNVTAADIRDFWQNQTSLASAKPTLRDILFSSAAAAAAAGGGGGGGHGDSGDYSPSSYFDVSSTVPVMREEVGIDDDPMCNFK